MRMPPQITDLDPNWKTCVWTSYGIFDPPIALHSVGNIFQSSSAAPPKPTPTDPEPVVSPTPAKPGQSGGDGIPVVTPPPTSPTDPNGPQDPQDPPNNNNPQDPPVNNNPNPTPGQNPTPNNPGPTNPANNPGNPSPPVITVGPTVIPVDPTGGVIINPGTTLTRGGAPIVISSTTFSIGDAGLTIISPSTSTKIPFGNGPVTVPLGPGNAPVTLDPAGSLVLGGTTLRPGAPAVTVDGTRMSVGSSGVVLVGPSGATSTIPIPAGDPSAPQIITIGSSTFTLANGNVMLAPGITIGFGDPAVTMSGTTFSIGPSGLVVGFLGSSSTVPIPMATQVVTVGSQTYTMYNGELVLAPGTTIGFGDPPVTVSGTTYSIGPSGLVVIGPSGTSTIPVLLSMQVITVGGHTYTMYDGELVLGPGTTLGPGDPAVTVDGTTFSVGPTGVVVLSSGGGTTMPVTATGTGDGSLNVSPTSPYGAAVTGTGAKSKWEWWWGGMGFVVGVLEVVL